MFAISVSSLRASNFETYLWFLLPLSPWRCSHLLDPANSLSLLAWKSVHVTVSNDNHLTANGKDTTVRATSVLLSVHC